MQLRPRVTLPSDESWDSLYSSLWRGIWGSSSSIHHVRVNAHNLHVIGLALLIHNNLTPYSWVHYKLSY